MYARSATPIVTQSSGRDPLFKLDYPRTIDRYIDYFEGTPASEDTGDACGEALLERLA